MLQQVREVGVAASPPMLSPQRLLLDGLEDNDEGDVPQLVEHHDKPIDLSSHVRKPAVTQNKLVSSPQAWVGSRLNLNGINGVVEGAHADESLRDSPRIGQRLAPEVANDQEGQGEMEDGGETQKVDEKETRVTDSTDTEEEDYFKSDWRLQKKHIFIISDSGKPVYSR